MRGVIIDQHSTERGRIGRLLGAVAHNPRELGISIDEDPAIIVDGDGFQVIGNGAVYVVDGSGATRSNIAEARLEQALSIYDLRLQVLSHSDLFDLAARRPSEAPSLETTHTLEAAALGAASSSGSIAAK